MTVLSICTAAKPFKFGDESSPPSDLKRLYIAESFYSGSSIVGEDSVKAQLIRLAEIPQGTTIIAVLDLEVEVIGLPDQFFH